MFAYHVTHQSNVASIMQDGLQINRDDDHFSTGPVVRQAFGIVPVCVSLEKPWDEHLYSMGINHISDAALLTVDISGLMLRPDLPSFPDHYHDYDEKYVRLDAHRAPYDTEEVLGSCVYEQAGYFLIHRRHWSRPHVIQFLSEITQTVAVMKTISPDRIAVTDLARMAA